MSYQKLVSIYERFSNGKLEFARPPSFQPALAGRASQLSITCIAGDAGKYEYKG